MNRSEKIRQIQKAYSCGLMQAAKILEKQELVQEIKEATTIDDIKQVLLKMI